MPEEMSKEDILRKLDSYNLLGLSFIHRQELDKDFTEKEVKDAVFQLGAWKASGPDGIPALVPQKCWNIMGPTITQATLGFLKSGFILKELNNTFIKCQSPEKVGDFRPISLCNVAYKIASKVLANRLKPIMEDIITPYQNAFIKGRLISDNLIIAHELIHTIKTKKKGQAQFATIKVDLSKAYDRLSWNFLEAVLQKMGFSQLWINSIMQCVSTVSYRILINGAPIENIKPTRGIRQGDPLSTYLFIICANILSCMLLDIENKGLIQGIDLRKGEMPISHLFFADDILLFMKLNKQTPEKLKEVLENFCKMSGQKINDSKSVMTVSPNCNSEEREELQHKFKIQMKNKIGIYLGFPLTHVPK